VFPTVISSIGVPVLDEFGAIVECGSHFCVFALSHPEVNIAKVLKEGGGSHRQHLSTSPTFLELSWESVVVPML
jgi:hypothetical protein